MQLDSDNPWPGLESFEEDAHAFFFGRDHEIKLLRDRVLDTPVTVLFGRSGLGKTSLLRAGVFPLLRERHFLPIHIRFELKTDAVPLTRQLHGAVRDSIQADVPGRPILPSDDESLWEYLHRKNFELWSARNYPLTPVIVLDQFEELFTLGERVPDLVDAFRNVLGDLAENRIPADLAQRINTDEGVAGRFNLRSRNYRLLISLREDFLPDLEGWSRLIPTLGRSRMRLLGLRTNEALDAVYKPAAHMMTHDLARQVVGFIAGKNLDSGRAPTSPEVVSSGVRNASGEIEPAFLSLFCRELNEQRKQHGQARFDKRLIKEGERDTLSNYYLKCVGGFDKRVAEFIESELITANGFRDFYAREDAVPDRLSEEELDALINSRLVRLEDRYGAQRIELTHDVLTRTVREHRDRRRAEEEKAELAEAAEREKQALEQAAAERDAELDRERQTGRRLKRLSAVLALVCVVAVVSAGVAVYNWQTAKAAREAATTRRNEAIALRLTSQGEAMLAGKRSGGDVRALQELIAAETIEPKASEGALLDAAIARRTMLKIIDTSAQVWSLAISPDGRQVVSGSIDGSLRVWDAETGRPVGKPLTGHTDAVTSVAFGADGHRIVSGGFDRSVRLWDADTGEPIGTPITGWSRGLVTSVAVSADGKRIASGSDDHNVRLWDSETGLLVGEPLTGHTDSVFSLAFSPDGKRIASGSSDGTVRVWDTATGKPVAEPLTGHNGSVLSVAFSPDGKRIASGSSDDIVRMWDAATGKSVSAPLTGHTDMVTDVKFSPDGRRIVSGSRDHTIRVWDADNGQPVGEPITGHADAVDGVAISPDGRRVVSGSRDNTVRVWDIATGRPMTGHTGRVMSVAFSPNGKWIASGSADQTVRVWDAATGQPVGQPITGHTDAISSVAFSPDSKWIASGSNDRTVRVWDAASGRPVGRPMTGHTDAISSVAFSPDGKWIASGSIDSTVRIWNAVTGDPVGDPLAHTDWVLSVAFSPDGRRIAAGSADGLVELWDADTQSAIGDPLVGHADMVTDVKFSPDGQKVVSGGADGAVRLWDTNTSKPIGDPLRGHTDTVTSVAFSPDGQRIVSGSVDDTVRVWDTNGEPIGSPMTGGQGDVTSVAVSPDGQTIAYSSGDETLRLWPTGASPETLCAKLTANMSRRQWRDWVSPEIDYIPQCDGLPIPPDAPT